MSNQNVVVRDLCLSRKLRFRWDTDLMWVSCWCRLTSPGCRSCCPLLA